MEDFGTMLWILIAIGAVIFITSSKALRKAREAAKKTLKEMQDDPRREAWPSWDAPQEYEQTGTAEPPAENVASRPEYRPIEIRTEGTPTASTLQPGYENASRHTTEFKRCRQELKSAVSTPGSEIEATPPPQTPEEGFAEQIRENFDVQQAVVYSEILKPKFDE